MSLQTLKAEVLAYVNRNAADLVVNGVDIIVQAANKARKQIQRIVDFELLRRSVRLTIPAGLGVNISTGTSFPVVSGGVNETVGINRIERAYLVTNAQIGAEVQANSLRPIDFQMRNQVAKRNQRLFDDRAGYYAPSSADVTNPQSSYPIVVRSADYVYMWPTQTTDTEIVLDVIAWAEDYTADSEGFYVTNTSNENSFLPPGNTVSFFSRGTLDGQTFFVTAPEDETKAVCYYNRDTNYWVIASSIDALDSVFWQLTDQGVSALRAGFEFEPQNFAAGGNLIDSTFSSVASGDSDFFLVDCYDWLSLHVMKQLSYFLGRDERFAITQKQVDEAFSAVLSWNNSTADSGSGQDYDLD